MRIRTVTLLVTLAAGCNGQDMGPDVGPRSNLSVDAAQAARTACMFKAGTLPGLSLDQAAPLGPEIPIDTVVILMMENRSFDHLLGNLKVYGQPDVDVAAADAANPDSKGMMIPRYHDTDYCFGDTNHEWSGAHTEYDGGKNDGFVIANEDMTTDGKRAMSYYTEDDVPISYFLANTFATSDRYFSSLLGPTFPNREYLYAATSFGLADNALITGKRVTMMSALESAGVSWHVYYDTLPGFGVFLDTLGAFLNTRVDRTSDFFDRAKTGMLENVVFLDPDLRNEWGGGSDFHPPGDVQNGDAWLAKVVDAVTHSPQWPHLALFITFDENGGIYDHVAPPPACPPDDLPPTVAEPAGAKFDRYGFRVPVFVISPYAKPHFVSHKVYDHTSIDRFVETRFHIPALTGRDANADPMLDFFDFGSPKLSSPPPLPAPKLDMARLMACEKKFPNTK